MCVGGACVREGKETGTPSAVSMPRAQPVRQLTFSFPAAALFPPAGEMYCELPAATNWNFDVQWAPGQLAGVFATATFEGQIALSSLSACTAVGGEADGFSIGQGEWAGGAGGSKCPVMKEAVGGARPRHAAASGCCTWW